MARTILISLLWTKFDNMTRQFAQILSWNFIITLLPCYGDALLPTLLSVGASAVQANIYNVDLNFDMEGVILNDLIICRKCVWYFRQDSYQFTKLLWLYVSASASNLISLSFFYLCAVAWQPWPAWEASSWKGFPWGRHLSCPDSTAGMLFQMFCF